jgi:hypothetical protein
MPGDMTRLEYTAVMAQLVVDARAAEQSLSDCRRRADLADQRAMAEARANGLLKTMELITAHRKDVEQKENNNKGEAV